MGSLPLPGKTTVKRIGLQPYKRVWEYQKNLQRKLIDGECGECLIVCEHYPVITLGTSAKAENILVEEKELSRRGIEVFKIERGGDVTCHTPGQIVLYPILDLNSYKRDVAWYMRSLEEAVVRTLADYGIRGLRVEGKTGVWLDDRQKIASIGVRISRWRTMHGLALNVRDGSHEIFDLIYPCGHRDAKACEMQQYSKIILDKDEVANNLINKFIGVFGIKTIVEDDCFES